MSPTTQTSEDPPAQSGPGDAFTSPPLRFTLYPLLGHCLTRRVWGQYFPLSACLGGGGVREWGVGRGVTKEGGYQCSAASSDEAVKVEAVEGVLKASSHMFLDVWISSVVSCSFHPLFDVCGVSPTSLQNIC